MPSRFESLAKYRLLCMNPLVEFKGFGQRLREGLFYDDAEEPALVDGEVLELLDHKGFIPDAFQIDMEKRHIVIYEIEDTCTLTDSKMDILIHFAFYLDCVYWLTTLVLLDRYGNFIHKLETHELNLICQSYGIPEREIKRTKALYLNESKKKLITTLTKLHKQHDDLQGAIDGGEYTKCIE